MIAQNLLQSNGRKNNRALQVSSASRGFGRYTMAQIKKTELTPRALTVYVKLDVVSNHHTEPRNKSGQPL